MKWWKNFIWWFEERKAQKESGENLEALAARRRAIVASIKQEEEEVPSATGAFATVKQALDSATEEHRKAKETAAKLTDSIPKL